MSGVPVDAWRGPERQKAPLRGRILRTLLTCMLILLCAGMSYTGILVSKWLNAPGEASRYNVTWLVSQAGVELARFQASVAGAALPNGGTSLDEVQLRFDILISRLETLQKGDVQAFIHSDSEFQEIVNHLRSVLDQAQPLIDHFDNPGAPAELYDLISPLQSKFARLASAANIRSADQVAKFQSELNYLYSLLLGVMAGAVICGAGLFFLQVRYGALQRAHAAVEKLAADLRQTGERFNAALSNMGQGLCLFDATGALIVYNDSFARMFGEPPNDAPAPLLGQSLGVPAMFAPPPPNTAHESDRRTFELADGRVIQVLRRAVPDEGWVSTYEDITERRRSEERLSYMARHDALTGLPNRVLFREMMEQFAPRVRDGEYVAVFCLGLDGFKAVNDALGHPNGDELLRLVARRLRRSVRDGDIVARLGGDEFAVIQVAAERLPDTGAIADRLIDLIRAPFDLHGQSVVVGTSVGIVVAEADCCAPDELLRNAEIALSQAKSDGGGTWCVFRPEMDVEIQRRRKLEVDMRNALEQEQFEVHYQALVCARTLAVTGFEALIRWQHPVRGMVSPGEFIPLAEETGLIKTIGNWVLRRACRDAATWPEHIKLAVNLSAVQFLGGQLVSEVQQALAGSGLAAARLQLEITESVLLREDDATLTTLLVLRELGVRISLDDFGTGYSSLSYLRRFPFNKIKVDQSFVRNLNREQGSIEIVRAVASVGKALGMEVLAEGVETPEQLEILQSEGYDEIQGFLISRPEPLAAVRNLISAKRSPQTGQDCASPVLAA